MKNIKKFENFQESNKKNIFVLNTNKELRGFAEWQTPEETLESFKSDLYFLGYEEYEGIFVEAKVSGNDIIISLDSDYSFNYINKREKDLEKFFRNVLAQILNDDYIKLYSIDGEKINIKNVE
jgi:hypothetical protein